MTLIRVDDPGREMVKVGRADGATRIWVCGGDGMSPPLPRGQIVGLHRHRGDEIFQVFSGTVRFHVDGRNIDVGAGHFVVVPPLTEHGYKILTDDARMQFIGELEMGEWVTIFGDDGTSREVEIRSNMFPWHRRPADGEEFDFLQMLQLLESTAHVFDAEASD
jgi:Cupin domain